MDGSRPYFFFPHQTQFLVSLALCVFRQHPVLRACGDPAAVHEPATGGFNHPGAINMWRVQ